VDEKGRTIPLAALEQLRLRIRTRHYSYRTECCYVDWARRFFDYLVDQQGGPQPQVHAEAVRDYLTHLAVHKRISASTQNQAMCAILFLCREVLALNPEALSLTPRAKPGQHLPVVLSIPETAALLAAMRGIPQIMAGVIYGGGLRVSECCELRVAFVGEEAYCIERSFDTDSGPPLLVHRGPKAWLRWRFASSPTTGPRPSLRRAPSRASSGRTRFTSRVAPS
jgi:integrase